ncbi:MAG: hypothetical protein HRU14_02850 [Planctomycetes bacterium]|nr:hypothetical protein [Planctomycetota bacterium]
MANTIWTTALLVAFTAVLPAQHEPGRFRPKDPDNNPVTAKKVELGRFLFESPLLSRNRKIACSTCHDPAEAFADGLTESRGIFETEVGRNSPTLWGIALHPGFLGELPKPARRPRGRPKRAPLLSLEERCLTPIENPIEMGNSMGQVIRTLKAVDGLRQRFDEAFGKRGAGINGDRIGKAIAAFLRTAEVPRSPYRSFVEGDIDALSDAELRGLQVFRSRGKCAACHTGNYLSDGRIHLVTPIDGLRAKRQTRKQRDRLRDLVERRADEVRHERKRRPDPLTPDKARKGQSLEDVLGANPQERPGGYGTGGISIQARGAQTPTLWDITNTAPYFRDGSVTDLETCVRQHVDEMQSAGSRQMSGCAPSILENPILAQIPKRLRPTYGSVTKIPKPAELNEDEVSDLIAFLGSLSPRKQTRR